MREKTKMENTDLSSAFANGVVSGQGVFKRQLDASLDLAQTKDILCKRLYGIDGVRCATGHLGMYKGHHAIIVRTNISTERPSETLSFCLMSRFATKASDPNLKQLLKFSKTLTSVSIKALSENIFTPTNQRSTIGDYRKDAVARSIDASIKLADRKDSISDHVFREESEHSDLIKTANDFEDVLAPQIATYRYGTGLWGKRNVIVIDTNIPASQGSDELLSIWMADKNTNNNIEIRLLSVNPYKFRSSVTNISQMMKAETPKEVMTVLGKASSISRMNTPA